jgi:toxin ParE1/3/4
MSGYYFTNKAVRDLTQIWEYSSATWSEDQAEKYYKEIIKICKKIVANPLIGKKYFGIMPGLYGRRVNRHIVFYRNIDPKTVEITRIIHEIMDIYDRFFE